MKRRDQSDPDDSTRSSDYLVVLSTCNTLLNNLGRNIWSKYFPEESGDIGKLNVEFNIEPGDNTPRKLMTCLAKQVHNFRCVSQILERVKAAEKLLQSLDDADDDEGDNRESGKSQNSGVDLARLNSLSSQLTVLTKCAVAMQGRHSVRHRVLPVEPGKVACQALCDIDCPVLGIRLCQQSSYILQSNRDQQLWTIEDPISGASQRVPPLFLAVEPDSGELARIGRVWSRLRQRASKLVALLANQLIDQVRSLGGQLEDLIKLPTLSTEEAMKLFLSQLQMLEAALKGLQADGGKEDANQWAALIQTVDSLLDKIHFDSAAKPVPIAPLLLKMQNELRALKSYASAMDNAAAPSARLQSSRDNFGGSRRSLRSGRSHRLNSSSRRTGVFEFEFEFVESTRKRSTSTTRPRRSASTSDLTSGGTRFTSETVTRQRQEKARKFVIQSVWNGRREVSLQDALATGVVNFERGVYIELLGSRVEMPLEAALSAGKIRVEQVTENQVSEDSSSYGLISVEELRQSTSSQSSGGNSLTYYVVHAVVDVAAKERLPFQEAVQKGLIDRETGVFTNTATGEHFEPAEAINKGFLKAYPVDDPSSLNIEPENRIAATNLNKLKSRWGAVSAFAKVRPAGKDGK